MTTTRPVQVSASSGELDPLLHQRPDFQRYQTGLMECKGFVPLRQGGFTRSPGTIYRGTTDGNKLAIRIPFIFARNDTLALEFTDLKMRVWRYGQLVLVSGGAPYELATPFTEADLPNLDWEQDNDLVYIVDGRQPKQLLSRFALDNWTIAPVDFTSGPFRAQNVDTSKKITPDGANGNINLAANTAIFDDSMVGALMLIKPTDFDNTPLWVGNATATVGDRVRNEDKIYELTQGDNTGANPPIHSFGKVRTDASKTTVWEFISTDEGIVRITAVNSATSADADVLQRVPLGAVNDATHRWSIGAWNDKYGYPSRLGRHKRRLYAANTLNDPRTVWASAIGDFKDHNPSTDADAAFAYEIDGNGSRNEITFLTSGQRGIYIGALGEVRRGFSAEAGEAIGPATFDTEAVDSAGGLKSKPVTPYNFPIYISIDGSRIQETRYSFEDDGSAPVELTLPSQHLGNEFFQQMVWQAAPEKYIWTRRASGDLVVMIYDPQQDVLGWAPIPVADGHVEHMDVTVSEDGIYDVVTMIVRRVINGQTVRYVEEQAINRRAILGSDPEHYFNHGFASKVFEPAAPTDTFNMDHLSNEEVWALTDMGHFGPLTVQANGLVILPEPVNRAIIGLKDESHRARTLPINAAGKDGDTRGRPRELHSGIGIGLHKTSAGKISAVERQPGREELQTIPADLTEIGVALDILETTTGIVSVDVPSGHANEVHLQFDPFGIAPMTITAIIPEAEEAGP